jgi:hypothetical protein
MASDIDLCNQALLAIGTRSYIVSFDETSAEARACARLYSDTRTKVLRQAPWGFARKDVVLTIQAAASGTPENPNGPVVWNDTLPPRPWQYAYLYPEDCVFVRKVYQSPQATQVQRFSNQGAFFSPDETRFNFTIGQVAGVKTILTDARQALLTYTFSATEVDQFDPLFSEALVKSLAAELVFPLTGSANAKATFIQEAMLAINEARVAAANEETTSDDRVPSWIEARGSWNAY